MCLWMWTVLKMWSQKHSLFVCRLTGYRAQHSHHFRRPPRRIGLCAPSSSTEAHSGQTGFRRKAPEAKRRCTRRRPMATSRLRSCCWAKAPRWTPRTPAAGASNPGSTGARHRGLADLGTSEGFSGIETYAFSRNVWQSCEFSTPKNAKHVGNNDHNVICQ